MRVFPLLVLLVAASPCAVACGMFTGVDSTGLVAADDDGGDESSDGGRRDSGSRDGGSHSDGGSGDHDSGGNGGEDGGSDFDSGLNGFDASLGFCASLEACCITISDFNCLLTAQAGNESACATLYVQYVTAGTCTQ